ncbi:hypothetical protein NMY22_g17715 [Coprinellus aureogranulatus]|nr:hypothetical protein NMY22_g17715 [Coprinellus aureogranulatus]
MSETRNSELSQKKEAETIFSELQEQLQDQLSRNKALRDVNSDLRTALETARSENWKINREVQALKERSAFLEERNGLLEDTVSWATNLVNEIARERDVAVEGNRQLRKHFAETNAIVREYLERRARVSQRVGDYRSEREAVLQVLMGNNNDGVCSGGSGNGLTHGEDTCDRADLDHPDADKAMETKRKE